MASGEATASGAGAGSGCAVREETERRAQMRWRGATARWSGLAAPISIQTGSGEGGGVGNEEGSGSCGFVARVSWSGGIRRPGWAWWVGPFGHVVCWAGARWVDYFLSF